MGSQQSATPIEFTEEQNRTVAGLASNMRLVAVILLVLGVVKIVCAVSLLLSGGVGRSLFYLIEGALTMFLGLVMLTASSDVRFIVTSKGHDHAHLMNAFTSLRHFYLAQLALGIIVALVVGIRLFV